MPVLSGSGSESGSKKASFDPDSDTDPDFTNELGDAQLELE